MKPRLPYEEFQDKYVSTVSPKQTISFKSMSRDRVNHLISRRDNGISSSKYNPKHDYVLKSMPKPVSFDPPSSRGKNTERMQRLIDDELSTGICSKGFQNCCYSRSRVFSKVKKY